MIFHTLGDRSNKAVILIHGALCPWQIWNNAAEHFSKDYFVVVPELDGHTQDKPTTLISVDDEALKILDYIKSELGEKVFLLVGLSLGGRIAATIAKDKDIKIDNLVLDGAPLSKLNGFMKWVTKKNYRAIVARSKARDPKTMKNAKKDFLPEELIPFYLKVADNMDDVTIVNMIDTVFADFEFIKYPDDMRILCMHGTKANEIVAKKSAVKMKQANPQTEIKCFNGLAHAELLCFRSEQWIKEVEGFIS